MWALYLQDRHFPGSVESGRRGPNLDTPASPQPLADAVGASAAAVTAKVQALAHAELVRGDDRGFVVAHDLVGDTVCDALDAVERMRLHQLLARALVSCPAAPGERAGHLAGAGDRPAATRAYAVAARERLDHFDEREAERLAEAGLALNPANAPRADLLEVRAETRARAGDLHGAREDLRAALTLAGTAATRSRLLTRMAVLASGSDDMIRAANLVDLAVVEAADDPAARARALATSAIIDMNLERRARADSRYKEALTLFEQVGDARGVADILDARAMAVFLDGDIGTAVDAFDRVAQLFVDSGNLLRVVTPRSTRGHALVVAGRPREVWQTPRRLWICRGPSATRKARRWSCGRTARRSPHSGGPRRPNTPLRTPCRSRSVSVAVAGRPRRCAASVSRTRPPATCQPPRTRSAGSLHKSQHLPLFSSWAHARLALLLVAMGRLEEAATHVDRALAMGPPLGQFEARVARCVLAVVRRQPNTSEMLQDAVHRATAGGHRASQARLSMLIDSWEAVSSTATHGDR